jgi:hypothetical protein
MKRLALSLVAAVALMGGLRSTASAYDHFTSGMAQDVYASTTQLPLVAINDCSGYAGCDGACDSCDCCDCCGQSAWIVDVEALFFRYGRVDGTQNVITGSPVQFDFELAPRLTVGYVGSSGLGFRIRYFEFDHTATGGLDSIDVNTFTIDQEFFENVQLTDYTSVEFSGGVRYVEFEERLNFPVLTEQTIFRGFGGIVGMQVNRQFWNGDLYARARGSILMDEKSFASPATNLVDAVVSITEVSLGYQINYDLSSGALLTLRSGVEWQHWTDFSVSQNTNGDTESSVGFAGFVLGGGLTY